MINAWMRLVRVGFQLLYNEFAFSYDAVSAVVSLGAWRCWTRQALAFLSAEERSTVLELAHGTGNLQLDLNAAGHQVIGYDLSPAMGRITRAKLMRAGLPIALARGLAQALPFPDGTFNAVISTFPTDFILDEHTLREVHRVLKPDGRLIIVPYARLTQQTLPARVVELLYRLTGQRSGDDKGDDIQCIVAFFAQQRFTLTGHTRDCPGSRVTILVATPQAQDASPA